MAELAAAEVANAGAQLSSTDRDAKAPMPGWETSTTADPAAQLHARGQLEANGLSSQPNAGLLSEQGAEEAAARYIVRPSVTCCSYKLPAQHVGCTTSAFIFAHAA